MIGMGFRGGFACSAGVVGESSGVTRYQIASMLESLGLNETITTMLASDMVQDALTSPPDRKRWVSMMRELIKMADSNRPGEPG